MLRLFKSKEEKELDALLVRVDNNMSNNYKDAAQENFKALCSRYDELLSAGKLNEKQQTHYTEIIEELRKELDKFTHKDQNARWMGGGVNT